ncbi:polysaccharide biosynthesis protein [Paenibacillus sp. GP183]|uniref:putative polysaccharide biosynthesis protein n=1 Tax=Paenibacillus sp. GP183 TaxID=1882751 RepID=UPI0008987C1E|nr:polysaccharide biosynthesis protein [Paenibacillus sp. GP183]SEC37749.1 Membrane protein involved in the export of O-antigen and teichoic acid [Paenibacillus sp. GP183]
MNEARLKSAKLLKGAAVLAAAAVISKLLGTLQKIPLQNIAGDGAFGIYNAVYPVYLFILFLATAGFPITISKFVSERVALGDFKGVERIVKVSTLLLMGTGLLFFFALYLGAEQIAGWIGIADTQRAIRSVSFALLFTPVLAVLRGYFQGQHDMVPTAVSQVIEQLVRVITMIALLLYFVFMEASMDWVAAGATFGSVTGAAAGLLVMLTYWLRDRRVRKLAAGKSEKASGTAPHVSDFQLVKQIASYAIPICLGTIVVPILTLVDTFTMPRLLAAAHLSEAEAMRQFGLYNRGLPLVQLVVMIASSLSVALVPALAEAQIKGDLELIRHRTKLSLKLTWLVGLGASFGLAFAAVPINLMLYKTSEASWTLAILAFTALFSTLNTVSASVLQGVGAVRTPALILFVAIVLKALGNVLLMPRWGIEGAALSAVIAFAAAAGLGLVQVARCTGIALRPSAAGPTLAVGLMGGCLAALQWGAKAAPAWLLPPERWAYSAIAFSCVVVGGAVYTAALLRSGTISREELRLVPGLDRRIVPVLERLKLIPKGTA